MSALSSSNTFITIPATQTNIHAVAPMGIFICGHMWPISNRWMHFNCHWCLFQVPRGCTPEGHSFKKFDKGLNLVSVEMENYLRSKGIHHAKSATYWPRSNGEVERYNQTLLKSIRAFHAEGKDWRSYFKTATTQVAPAMLLFNRDIRNHFPLLNKTTNLSHQEKQKETTPTPK